VLGNEHSCATSADGAVRCWGSNRDGQLGVEGTGDSLSPIAIAPPRVR
jgi:alpha-tubulin suppressor-like RCC1 family protein